MIPTSSISIFSFVSFSLVAPAVLGSGYQGAEVLGVVDYTSAQQYNPIATIHADIAPSLPPGTPDYTKYPYLKLRLTDGNIVSIGLPWIVDASWTVEQTQTMTITVPSTSPEDQTRVTAALSAIGMRNFTVVLSTPT